MPPKGPYRFQRLAKVESCCEYTFGHRVHLPGFKSTVTVGSPLVCPTL